MKVTDIQDYESDIKITDFENFFEVYDQDDFYKYNLNSSMTIDIDEEYLKEHVLKTNAFWTLVSYKLYGTTRLTWLLLKLNDVSLKDSMKVLQPGTTVKYVSEDVVKMILKEMD